MPFKLTDQAETHFNTYRGHFPQLLVEGALYQFEDFFSGIRVTLGSLFPGMGAVLEFLKKAREAAGSIVIRDIGADGPDWFIWGPVLRRYVKLGELKTSYGLADLITLHDAIREIDERQSKF